MGLFTLQERAVFYIFADNSVSSQQKFSWHFQGKRKRWFTFGGDPNFGYGSKNCFKGSLIDRTMLDMSRWKSVLSEHKQFWMFFLHIWTFIILIWHCFGFVLTFGHFLLPTKLLLSCHQQNLSFTNRSINNYFFLLDFLLLILSLSFKFGLVCWHLVSPHYGFIFVISTELLIHINWYINKIEYMFSSHFYRTILYLICPLHSPYT